MGIHRGTMDVVIHLMQFLVVHRLLTKTKGPFKHIASSMRAFTGWSHYGSDVCTHSRYNIIFTLLLHMDTSTRQAEKQDKIKQAVTKIYNKQKYELQAIPKSSCLRVGAENLTTALTFTRMGAYRRQLLTSKWMQSAKLENHLVQLAAMARRRELCRITKVKADIELEYLRADIGDKFGPFELGVFPSRTPGKKDRPAVPRFG
jgi:hypothetical protein